MQKRIARVDPVTIEQLRARSAAGESYGALARAFGLAPHRVRRLVRPDARPKFTQWEGMADFIDALRECLDKRPLYRDPRRSVGERFAPEARGFG